MQRKPKRHKVCIGWQVDNLASSTGAGVTVQVLLMYYKNVGCLTGDKTRLRMLYFPNKSAEPEKFRAAMELVEAVVTDEQWNLLCMTESGNTHEFHDVCRDLQKKCLATMHSMEEAIGLKEPLTGKKAERARPCFVGLGAHVIKYKSKAKKSSLLEEEKPGLIASIIFSRPFKIVLQSLLQQLTTHMPKRSS